MAALSQIPHVRELCVTEMLARTCKNIINLKMSELILDNKAEYNQLKNLLNQKEIEIKDREKYRTF
jgi:hypothetical protein